MRWSRFQVEGRTVYGIVEGDEVVEVEGTPLGDHRRTQNRHSLGAVKLLVPVEPPMVYASGVANYRAHVEWAANFFGRTPGSPPTRADVSYRSPTALTASGDPIVIPKDASDEVHYENELVVVIGRRAKNLTRENALSCVLGYTIGNDVSERTWQAKDSTFWRSKDSDTFKPMGPWIETDFDLARATSIVRINGQEVSRFATGDFLFDIPYYLSELSKYVALLPGDVFWMGTDGATLPPIKDGDTVECEITGIGVLQSPVRRER